MNLSELKRLKAESTEVVAWYPHNREVRGPFCRWFTCDGGDNGMGDPVKYPTPVAPIENDCRYAAAAMNVLPALIEEVERLREALDEYHEMRGNHGAMEHLEPCRACEALAASRERWGS